MSNVRAITLEPGYITIRGDSGPGTRYNVRKFLDGITTTYYTGDSTLYIIDTYTQIAAAAHKSIRSELTYAPATAGTACPIAIVGKLTLNGDLTAANTYPGMGWGIQGQVHIATGSVIDGSTYGDPGAIYAGVRGVVTDTGSSTYTKGILTCFYGDMQLTQNASSGVNFEVYGMYLFLYHAVSSTTMDALLCLDRHSGVTTDSAIEKGIFIKCGMTTAIDIDPAAGAITTGIDIGTVTTGINLTGTQTTGLYVSGTIATAILVTSGRTFLGDWSNHTVATTTDNYGLSAFNVQSTAIVSAAGASTIRAAWLRHKMTTKREDRGSSMGAEIQLRIQDLCSTIGNSVAGGAYSALWAYVQATGITGSSLTLVKCALSGIDIAVNVDQPITDSTSHIHGLTVKSMVSNKSGLNASSRFAGIHITRVSSGYVNWNTGIIIENCDVAFTAAITLTAATTVGTITVTDSSTVATGRGIGLFIDYAMTGTKTGDYGVRSSRINTSIGADVDSVIVADWYMHTIVDRTIVWLMGLSMYWEDYGNAVTALAMIDLGINSPHDVTGYRHAFIRCREHHTVRADSTVLQLEGTNGAAFLVDFDAPADSANGCLVTDSDDANVNYGIKVRLRSEGVTKYIHLHD